MRKGVRSTLLWVLSAASVFCMLVLLSRITDFRYENSDDSLILKAFMGFEGGTPAKYSLYLHPLLAWLLHAVSSFAPHLPWFTLFQFFLLYISCVALLLGFVRLSQGSGNPRLLGFAVGLLYLGVFAFFACCRPSYVTTSALASAAALVQWLALIRERPRAASMLWGSLLPLFLLLCAYCLRALAALPGAAFCALAFLPAFFEKMNPRERKSPIASLFIPAALVVVCLSLLLGLNRYTAAQPEIAQSLDWHAARTSLMDYTPFEQDPAPALAAAKAAGLSPTQITLMQEWYFMDKNIDANALHELSAAYPKEALPERASQAVAIIARFLTNNSRYSLSVLMLVALCLLCLLCHRKGRSPVLPIAALLGLAGAGACLFYLALQGRFLPRVVDTVLFPAVALEAGLFLMSLSEFSQRSTFRRVIIASFCAVCLALSGTHIAFTQHAVSGKPDVVSLQREADLERFALQNPDKLIFRTPNLLRDTRLFPDVSAGVPVNIILWGDWHCHMSSWYTQLRRYGIDGETFTAADWLRPNVLFATVSDEKPPEALLLHIGEQTGSAARATLAGEAGTLSFYSFDLVP